jgi:hypothetical protein
MLDETGDLAIKNGDLVIGESTLQHQRLLLLATKGGFKQNPTVGVDISSYMLDDSSVDELHGDIQQQFETDGMKVSSITGKTVENTVIKADYK